MGRSESYRFNGCLLKTCCDVGEAGCIGCREGRYMLNHAID